MKKIFSIAIVVLMLFALAACNNDELEKRNDEMETKMQAQMDKIAELEAKMQAQMDKITDLEQSKSQQEGQISELEQLLIDTRQEKEDIKQELDAKQNLIDEVRDLLIIDKVDWDHDIKIDHTINGDCVPLISSNACAVRFYNVVQDRKDVKVTYACSYDQKPKDPEDEEEHALRNNIPNYAEIKIRHEGIDAEGREIYYPDEYTVATIENYYSYTRENYYISSVDELSYCIEITIPEEFFEDEIGWIGIYNSIYCWTRNSTSGEEGFVKDEMGASVIIYYQAIGQSIILSPQITVNGKVFGYK